MSSEPSSQPFNLCDLGPFTEEEMTAMARALFKKIDVPIKSSGPAPKRPLIEYFGTQKAYKTSVTVEVDKFFRRNKFKTFCPPESAEHEDIRAETGDNPIVFQAKHLNVVIDQYLSLGQNRDGHLGQMSRNLSDMLYWYEKGLRKGIYSERHANSAKEWIYELLRQNLIDVSLFFSCSVEAAIKREFGQSVTQKRGSKMNEKDVAQGLEIYNAIIEGIKINVPALPLFRVDTSEMTVKQATEEALRFILPTLCIRFDVPDYSFMPYALSLLEKRAQSSPYFEEQLKLSGHPDLKRINETGWILVKDNVQKDIYLASKDSKALNPWGEVLRLRYEDNSCKFMYKSSPKDQLLSHRRPVSFLVEENEAKKILNDYNSIVSLEKRRLNFKKEDSDGNYFTLHIDSIDSIGNFTEIRARGTQEKNHTRELLFLAEELGFNTSSIVQGNYLSLATYS